MGSKTTSDAIIKHEKQIVKELAGLSGIDKVVLNDNGWDSRVYNIKGSEYYVKFPRSTKFQKRYAYQIAALKLAAGINTAVKTPKVIWEHPDNDYFGYEGVKGLALAVVVADLDESVKQIIGESLGEFLKQFHRLRLPIARDMNIVEEIKQFQNWYTKGLSEIRKSFTADEQQKLEKLVYKDWPDELLQLGSDTMLCHGDLQFQNIIYGGGQVGVIDFGDVCNCDLSKDFIGLEDSAIFEAVLKAHGGVNEELRSKIAIRQKVVLRLIELPYFMSKHNDLNIKKTLAKIKESTNL